MDFTILVCARKLAPLMDIVQSIKQKYLKRGMNIAGLISSSLDTVMTLIWAEKVPEIRLLGVKFISGLVRDT
jgi:hypothetical protein